MREDGEEGMLGVGESREDMRKRKMNKKVQKRKKENKKLKRRNSK